MLTRRELFRRMAGGVVTVVAAVHAPGWILSSTHTGRRVACEYLRAEYLAFTARVGVSPTKIRVGTALYETFVNELMANERLIEQMPTWQQQYAAWLPESFLFKGAIVQEWGDGWHVRMS